MPLRSDALPVTTQRRSGGLNADRLPGGGQAVSIPEPPEVSYLRGVGSAATIGLLPSEKIKQGMERFLTGSARLGARLGLDEFGGQPFTPDDIVRFEGSEIPSVELFGKTIEPQRVIHGTGTGLGFAAGAPGKIFQAASAATKAGGKQLTKTGIEAGMRGSRTAPIFSRVGRALESAMAEFAGGGAAVGVAESVAAGEHRESAALPLLRAAQGAIGGPLVLLGIRGGQAIIKAAGRQAQVPLERLSAAIRKIRGQDSAPFKSFDEVADFVRTSEPKALAAELSAHPAELAPASRIARPTKGVSKSIPAETPPQPGTDTYMNWWRTLTPDEQQGELLRRGVKKTVAQVERERGAVDFGKSGTPTTVSAPEEVRARVAIDKVPNALEAVTRYFNTWIAPVRHIAERHPASKKIAALGRETMRNMERDQFHIDTTIDDIYRGMGLKQRQKVAQLLDRKVSPAELAAQPRAIREAYTKARSNLQDAKGYVAQHKLADVGKWSIPDDEYFPHIFVGSYQVKVGNKTIDGGFAKTIGEALDKASDYLRLDPKAAISIGPREFSRDYSSTLLSRKGFFRLVGQLKEATSLDKKQIMNMMQGVAATKPRPKFVGNFRQRIANLAGSVDDPQLASKVYWNRVIRKRYLDPFRRKSAEHLRELPPDLRAYMDEYIADVSGVFDPFDENFVIRKATDKVIRAQSQLKLGYRPITALVNRLQPLQTSYPEIGNYLFRGRFLKNTPIGKELIKDSAIQERPLQFSVGEFRIPQQVGIFKPLGIFTKAEVANRQDTLMGGYLYAKEKLRLPHIQAKKFAIDHVEQSQFIYDVSDLPRFIRRGPFGRLIGQFRPYQINYFYRTAQVLKKAPQDPSIAARWLTTNIAMGGLKAIPYAARIGLLAETFVHAPKIAHGIMGLLGIDVAQAIGPGEPIPIQADRAVEELLGVTGRDIGTIVRAVSNDDLGSLINLVPAARDVMRAYEGEIRSTGRGRLTVKLEPHERALIAAGIRSTRVGREFDLATAQRSANENYRKQKAQYVDQIINAIDKDDSGAIDRILDAAYSDGITINFDNIRGAIELKNIPLSERLFRNLPKDLRERFVEEVIQ